MKMSMENRPAKTRRSDQSGSAVIVAIFFLLFVAVVVSASVINRVREGRSREMSQTQLEETWQARAAAAVLTRVIKIRLPEKYLQDVALAKNCPDVSPELESFESQTIVKGASQAVFISEKGDVQCNEGDHSEYTSLFGDADAYLAAQRPYLEGQSAALGFSSEQARIFSLEEAVRRFSAAAEPAYQIHFIIDGRGGRYGQARVEEDVILGSLTSNCGTTASLKTDTNSVAGGGAVTFTVTYSMATHLKIYENNGGSIIHEADVSEDVNPQDYTFKYAPDGSNSYRVIATGSLAGCASQSGGVVVDVTPSSSGGCAVNPPLISLFSASSKQVAPGGEAVLQWQTGGALSAVTLNGNPVNPNETGYRTVVNTDTTFSLIAAGSDPANNCPAQKDVVVRVSGSSCVLPTPNVAFSSSNTSVQVGEAVDLTWEVGSLDGSGQVIFTDADGSAAKVAASGSAARRMSVAGTYIYKITGKNKCPDGTEQAAEKIVSVTVSNSCPVPVINSFAANPGSVYYGGNQSVRLEWNIGGITDSVNIGGVGSVTGNYIFIPQPQSTATYTLTAAGCAVTRTAQVTIVVAVNAAICSAGQRLRTANRSVATTFVGQPYVNPYIEITAGAGFNESSRQINFNFSISGYAASQNASPNGSPILQPSGAPLIEIGRLRFIPGAQPARVAVYLDDGTSPGQLISSIPLQYISYQAGQAGNVPYYLHYYSVNSGSPFSDDGVDIPYTFDSSFDPRSAVMKINSALFAAYAPSSNGGGSSFNTNNTASSIAFGCSN